MSRPDNYAIQAQQAKNRFLTYDQQKLIRKLHLKWDETYIYLPVLAQLHRIHGEAGIWNGRRRKAGRMPTPLER